jgi:hypothetical protein
MRQFVIGCLIVLGVVLVVAVIGALVVVLVGYRIFSGVSTAATEREQRVIAEHYYPVEHAAALPPRGTQIILSGTHPTKGSEDGRQTLESITGTFFLDVDDPRLTALDETAQPASSRRVARHVPGITSDLDIHDDGTVRATAVDDKIEKTYPAQSRRSPDGMWYAYADLSRFADGAAFIVVKADGTGERIVARGLPKSGHSFFWSPDSTKAFDYVYDTGLDRDPNRPNTKNAIYVASLDAKAARKVWEEAEPSNYYLGFLRYIPSRDLILFSRENRLESIDVATGKTGVFWTSSEPATLGNAFPSPDATKLGVLQDGIVRIVDVASGRLLSSASTDSDAGRRILSFVFAPGGDRLVCFATGGDDSVSHADYANWTSWHIDNSYLYVVNLDGSGLRRLGDKSVNLDIVDVYEH